jgi:hypothetical protein
LNIGTELHVPNLLLQWLVSDSFYLENVCFMMGVGGLKLIAIACVAIVCKAAGEIKISFFSNSL